MQHRRTPPALPADLQERLGRPEDVFGPNWRFLTSSTIAGAGLVLLGVVFCSVWAASVPRGRAPEGPLYLLLGGGLMTCGLAAVVLPRQVPPTWIFVCPRGLVRVRVEDWRVIEWAEVIRFEDAALPAGVQVRQCRLVLAGGGEWGFLANSVADYPRLTEVLRRKVAPTL
ncbi:hypothetical protein [Fimbriiglobus ruber]|uniref:PH domain-containing protein n=1 Tax=Fimbriiglobus ruber TaxID=1908690 RepID=A0A225DW52_9BACT|nr:hypothetical protein [Fimbriiglobus ruber]OWK45612.1 hypothetical protein FRUB_01943 [Fimbriiglobus ruber]